MDSIIRYTRKVPTWKVILGFALVFMSIYGFIFVSVFNGIIFIILAFLLMKTEGSEIDLESKTYRKIQSFLGIRIGKWQPLPQAEYISVFATTEDITVRAISAQTTNTRDIILLNLFYDRNKKFPVYATNNLKDAFDVASHIADALLIDVLDATKKGDYQWVDKNILRDEGKIVYVE
ncbi:MAG: hypothetical protein GYB32_00070 [Algicola sp.]|nr:hypothetical protein [Algicola sp.]